MATSSSNKLTKYTSGTTIVTADVANSWFGGLYGSYEATLLDADDPRVVGHKHDGEPYDGHSSKIDLVDHVVGKLQNQNLADEAVMVNNVAAFIDRNVAIPESVIIDGDTYYYLDLSDVYTYIDDGISETPFETVDTNANGTDDTVRQSDTNYDNTGLDFVFGSQKLDDLGSGTNGDNRFFFDKSKGVFRAGSVNSTQWDDANRGSNSAAFGSNNTVSGTGGFSAGDGNTLSSNYSTIIGQENSAGAESHYSAVFGQSNSTTVQHSLLSGYRAVSTISGEVVHASGRFATSGDAQSSEFTLRGALIASTVSPGVILTADGVLEKYVLETNSAYTITVNLIGKTASPLVGAGFYMLQSLGVGSTTVVPNATISVPVISYISRTAYFTAGPTYIDVNITVSATGAIEVRVWDATPALTFFPTRWVATVSITKCKY